MQKESLRWTKRTLAQFFPAWSVHNNGGETDFSITADELNHRLRRLYVEAQPKNKEKGECHSFS